MDTNYIRPIAICVFRNEGRILAFRGQDTVTGSRFYRPLGGGIEFGEHSKDAVVREIREELGAGVRGVHLLGTLENIYMLDGELGHEIVQVYDASFVDSALYEEEWLDGDEEGAPFKAYWKSLEAFERGDERLVPDGLIHLLREVAVGPGSSERESSGA